MNALQDYLVAEILKKFPSNSVAVKQLSDLLSKSSNAIYQRLSKSAAFSLDEIELLTRTYDVSLDTFIFKKSDAVVFTFNPFSHIVRSFDDYLDDIHKDITLLNRLPNVHITNASAEIPFFFYMFYPELFCFKMYVWGRTIWNFDYLQNRQFDLHVLTHPEIQKGIDISNMYRLIASTELWSLNIMDNTLNQIEYHVNTGSFAQPQDALLLCQRLAQLAEHMEKMAFHGKKFAVGAPAEASGGDFELFHNEMIYTNNTIFVKTPFGRTIYTTYGNPNILKTTDEKMCDYTEGWLQSIMLKSRPVSQQGESGRKFFFDRLRRRIEAVRKRVEIALNGQEDDGF